jgi:hypothetical protein
MGDSTVPETSARKRADRRQPWTLADRINFTGVIIALVAAVLGIIGGVPGIADFYHNDFQQPRAAIVVPRDGQVFATNRIGVKGTAEHISGDSDLWLSVSGNSDQVYPVAELQVRAGWWSASEKQVCFLIGKGPQRFDVWIAPDTDDGEFVADEQKEYPIAFNSVPTGFVKLFQIDFRVRRIVTRC